MCFKFSKNIPVGVHFSKVVGGRPTVGVWICSQTFFKEFDCKLVAYFVDHLFFSSANLKSNLVFPLFFGQEVSFMKLCSFMN